MVRFGLFARKFSSQAFYEEKMRRAGEKVCAQFGVKSMSGPMPIVENDAEALAKGFKPGAYLLRAKDGEAMKGKKPFTAEDIRRNLESMEGMPKVFY